MLVYRLIGLRKGHLRGGVTDWHQVERLTGVGPQVVVLLVADRVGGVMERLGRGRVVSADLPSCRGMKAVVGVNKINPCKNNKKINS